VSKVGCGSCFRSDGEDGRPTWKVPVRRSGRQWSLSRAGRVIEDRGGAAWVRDQDVEAPLHRAAE